MTNRPSDHADNAKDYSRRQVLNFAPGIIATATPTALLGFTCTAAAQTGDQADWRFCNKCNAMFWNGVPDKGRCPTGGAHVAQGFLFFIHYDGAKRGAQLQYDWRFCTKCKVMFWDGHPNKGRCTAGGAHQAQGLMFGLDHQPPKQQHQRDWRFCNKCNTLFWDGNPNKGRCPAGGGHNAQGYNFHMIFKHASTDPGQAISDVLREVIEANRGALENGIKQFIGKGDLIARGVSLYNINFRLGSLDFRFNRPTFEYRINNTYLYFKSTTPSVIGSYGDPAFEVHFDSLFRGSVIESGGKPRVSNVIVSIPRITIKPRNVSGGVVTTVVHFFQLTGPGARLIQQAHDKYLNVNLTGRINDYLSRF